MFDKLERIPKVSGIELYIQLEPCAEVGIEKIQQTTTSLQVTVPNAQYEYFTHVEDDDDDDDDDDDYVDKTAINGEDFVDRDEYEERIEWGDFERDIDDDEIFNHSEPDANNAIIWQWGLTMMYILVLLINNIGNILNPKEEISWFYVHTSTEEKKKAIKSN